MKKYLFFLLIIFLVFFTASLYFLDKQYFISPIRYKCDFQVRCDARGDGFFAARRGNGRRSHAGIDLLADLGTPVYAAASGRVIISGSNNGMGIHVIIQHADNITTVYGHLSAAFVRKDQFIRQGQIIGSVGNTGNARSQGMLPHLHFEARKAGVPQDPTEYLD